MITQKPSKTRIIINVAILLSAIATITYFFAFMFYTRTYEFYLSSTMLLDYRIFGVVFVSLLSGLIVYLVALQHELSHWLSAKILKYRNKMFGIFALGIGGFFVNPEIPLRDRTSQILTGLYGSIIPIFTGVVLLIISSKTLALMSFNGVLINPLVFYFQMFSILFFFVAMLLGVFNLFPIIKGNDGYNVLRFVFYKRKHKKVHLYATQFIAFVLFFVLFNKIFYFNGLYLLGLLVILILTNLFMHFFEKTYQSFNPKHSKSGFYRAKLGVVYYYFASIPSLPKEN